MGLFSKDIKTMEDMFVHGLQDIYYAEHQISKALPQMIKQATNRDLAAGLKSHLKETEKQIERLEQVFKKLGKEPSAIDCTAIDGIIKRPRKRQARLTIRPSWTTPSSLTRRPSSIMRSHAMEH
jgi:ferritin-like metal-binding protein YciE